MNISHKQIKDQAAKRRKLALSMWAAGMSAIKIGEKLGVNRVRVYQILNGTKKGKKEKR